MAASCYVCCPAYALHGPLDRRRAIGAIEELANDLGFDVVLSPLLDRHLGHGCWLPVEQRIADFRRALKHEVVWACRGGYGSIHLIPTVLEAKLRHRPALIGYSDLTALHAAWRVRGWEETFYGALPHEAPGSRSHDTLRALMHGQGYRRDQLSDAMTLVLRPGRARGRCFAACLSVLAGLCGTAAMPDLRGQVLAIEDIDEHPYRLDSFLNQLHLSGALKGVVALIGGSFSHEEKPDYVGPSVEDILRDWAQRLRVPTITRLPFGHLNDGLFLPSGRPVELIADARGRWSFTVAARTRRAPWVP